MHIPASPFSWRRVNQSDGCQLVRVNRPRAYSGARRRSAALFIFLLMPHT